MSGSLGLSTPWARQGITKEDRLDVEAAIPDGHTLGVSMTPNRDKWIFWVVRPGENSRGYSRLKVSSSMSLTSAAFFALRHYKLTTDTVVRLDPEGYVRSIEDAG